MSTERHEDVGDRVRRLRLAKRWSRYDLVRATGLSETTVSRLELAGRCTERTAALVANALGTTPEALRGGDEPQSGGQP